MQRPKTIPCFIFIIIVQRVPSLGWRPWLHLAWSKQRTERQPLPQTACNINRSGCNKETGGNWGNNAGEFAKQKQWSQPTICLIPVEFSVDAKPEESVMVVKENKRQVAINRQVFSCTVHSTMGFSSMTKAPRLYHYKKEEEGVSMRKSKFLPENVPNEWGGFMSLAQ